jgi:dihydropteroate synthase
VMRAALAAGASMVNDITALREPGALECVAQSDAAVCLMHMQNDPATMQRQPTYADVVAEVLAFLVERVAVVKAVGVAENRIVIDPGFGFGKSTAHNLTLLAHLDRFADLGLPVLVGLSRKSMLGEVTDRPVDLRGSASVAAALLAAERGASIVRVHDVAQTRDALSVLAAVRASQ